MEKAAQNVWQHHSVGPGERRGNVGHIWVEEAIRIATLTEFYKSVRGYNVTED
jgi:hypothetical protein